jgi:hypothetical protein
VVRVPAGLGVLEAVFLQIFDGTVRSAAILAMLIAWRAVFLLAPLVLASGCARGARAARRRKAVGVAILRDAMNPADSARRVRLALCLTALSAFLHGYGCRSRARWCSTRCTSARS